jgi:ribosomal-protein-alanine N-acetyltransferase
MPRILEIEREAISPPWTHGALLSEIYNGDSFFAVAHSELGTQGGKLSGNQISSLLGFVILKRAADEGELLRIAVDSSARRCGAADSLMSAAFDHAKENAVKSIFLEVRKSNEAAIGLYKKHGFKQVRYRKDYYSDPIEDALIMVRSFE